VAFISGLIYNYLPEKIKRRINKSRLMDAAILHDIGKIGIPDNILNKPDKLTQEERHVVKQHAIVGKNILNNTSYQQIGEIISCHHERVDGNGYFNKTSDHIPLESKIIAVADTFSALCTDRVYRPKKSFNEAVQIIQEVSGTQLDLEIVKVFCSIPQEKLEFLDN
jgi:HD-GYP domain-containing protein (c-di-GMP phosphodiesterase class II)